MKRLSLVLVFLALACGLVFAGPAEEKPAETPAETSAAAEPMMKLPAGMRRSCRPREVFSRSPGGVSAVASDRGLSFFGTDSASARTKP